jgi:hypothetical protein
MSRGRREGAPGGDDSRPVGDVVAVLGLARAAGAAGAPLPGRPWVTARFEAPLAWRLTRPRWLLALDAALIVDLPHGDFRVLQRGEALELPADVDLRLQPVKAAVAVLWLDGAPD